MRGVNLEEFIDAGADCRKGAPPGAAVVPSGGSVSTSESRNLMKIYVSCVPHWIVTEYGIAHGIGVFWVEMRERLDWME
ncbi:16040_t:CDS:2 [Acaulospora colombiana]|uniref:16040_t:CDS:1 n=1 Tax=Acaulospora colombiana TaxID=27376 RepID=A0ACA9PMY4_9GLOM|nr:16040_t:CDS:2 [Acaulospora colombiana]